MIKKIIIRRKKAASAKGKSPVMANNNKINQAIASLYGVLKAAKKIGNQSEIAKIEKQIQELRKK